LNKDILRGISAEIEKELDNLNELRKEMRGIRRRLGLSLPF